MPLNKRQLNKYIQHICMYVCRTVRKAMHSTCNHKLNFVRMLVNSLWNGQERYGHNSLIHHLFSPLQNFQQIRE